MLNETSERLWFFFFLRAAPKAAQLSYIQSTQYFKALHFEVSFSEPQEYLFFYLAKYVMRPRQESMGKESLLICGVSLSSVTVITFAELVNEK